MDPTTQTSSPCPLRKGKHDGDTYVTLLSLKRNSVKLTTFVFFYSSTPLSLYGYQTPKAYIAQLRYDHVNGRRIAPINYNYSNSKTESSRLTPINSNLCRVNKCMTPHTDDVSHTDWTSCHSVLRFRVQVVYLLRYKKSP